MYVREQRVGLSARKCWKTAKLLTADFVKITHQALVQSNNQGRIYLNFYDGEKEYFTKWVRLRYKPIQPVS